MYTPIEIISFQDCEGVEEARLVKHSKDYYELIDMDTFETFAVNNVTVLGDQTIVTTYEGTYVFV